MGEDFRISWGGKALRSQGGERGGKDLNRNSREEKAQDLGGKGGRDLNRGKRSEDLTGGERS